MLLLCSKLPGFLSYMVVFWHDDLISGERTRACFTLAKGGVKNACQYQRFRHRSRTWGLRKLPAHKWAGRRMWSCHHSASPPPARQRLLLLPWLLCRLTVHPRGETPTNSLSIRLKSKSTKEMRVSTDYIHSHVLKDYSNRWPTSVLLYRITWRHQEHLESSINWKHEWCTWKYLISRQTHFWTHDRTWWRRAIHYQQQLIFFLAKTKLHKTQALKCSINTQNLRLASMSTN